MAARPSKIRVNPLYPRHPRCHYSYGRRHQNGRKAIKNPRKSAKIRVIRVAIIPTGGVTKMAARPSKSAQIRKPSFTPDCEL